MGQLSETSIYKMNISRYRSFIQAFEGVNKETTYKMMSERMNTPIEELRLSKITQELLPKVLEDMKVWKYELTGSRNLRKGVNIKAYAKRRVGEKVLKVVEIFNSIDGEGIKAGELVTFIRLYGCNLNCSYCDSRYACEKTEENLPYTEMCIDEIIQKCDEMREKFGTRNITLTGGEPLIHNDVRYLLMALTEADYCVNVETNGSVDIDKFKKYNFFNKIIYTIDYKSPSSGMMEKMVENNFYRDDYIDGKIIYKFVVGSKEDLDEAKMVIGKILLHCKDKYSLPGAIYLSPVFGKIEPSEIVEYMQHYEFYDQEIPIKIQLQLHKFIWDPNKRGV